MPFEYPNEVTDLELVPDNSKSLYVANEDSTAFVLDADLAGRLDTSKLKNALNKERNQNREGAATLEGWRGLGYETVADAQTAFEEMKNAVASGEKGSVDFDKWRLDNEAKTNKLLSAKDEEVNQANNTVREYLIDNAATGILADKQQGLAGSADLIMPHVRAQTEAVKGDDGKYVVRVKDLENPGHYRSNGDGGFMSVKELLVEMKASPGLSRAFDAEVKKGLETVTPNLGGMRTQKGGMTPNQKISAGLRKRG
ncbi:MAG: hypothetical protein COA47_10390 [Robiginitomaculum sp.]|nr:MAG: hypothetical protein COA47_10390 [Robiginitomaculum sp.]